MSDAAVRTYAPAACAPFRRLAARLGALSNMARGFPLTVSAVTFSASEALYQSLRFPHLPDVQRAIASAPDPQSAKHATTLWRTRSRPDWDAVRVEAMRWTLRVKLAQHAKAFGEVLLSTGTLPIVEVSTHDDFWGAKPQAGGTYVGANVLGVLLTALRDSLRGTPPCGAAPRHFASVPPPAIPNCLLFGAPIPEIPGTCAELGE
ncbi:MAG TPA: NADAR family protein [Polyangiaceae bacterium]|jgi:ribA/ribD-fused uncharacterized protein